MKHPKNMTPLEMVQALNQKLAELRAAVETLGALPPDDPFLQDMTEDLKKAEAIVRSFEEKALGEPRGPGKDLGWPS